MNIKSVNFDEKNNINTIDVDMSNEEIRWFVAFAFNQLFKAGMFVLDQDKYVPNEKLQKELKGTNE